MSPVLPALLRCLRRLCGLALLAGWCQAWAGQPLELPAASARLDLLGHLSVLIDRDASLDVGQALAHPGWRPAAASDLSLGLTAAALWLRLDLHGGAEPGTHWIAFGNPRLEEVQLYRIEAGRAVEVARAGLLHPPPVPLARGMDAVFELTLAPGEHARLLLRVHGRTSLMTQPRLWQPLDYLEQQAAKDLQYLLPAGLMLGLVLYLLASTWWLRSRLPFLLALWMFVSVIHDLAFHGYLRSYLLPQGSALTARFVPALSLLTVVMLTVYWYFYLEMWKRRGWRLFYRIVVVACSALLLATLFAPLLWVNRLNLLVLLLIFLAWPFSLLQPWREGVSHVRIFVLAMICGWLFNMIRILNLTGWLPASSLMVLSLQVTVLFKVLITFVLLYATVRHSTAQSRAFAALQAELIADQQLKQERLEEPVQLRSAALRRAVIDADEAVRAKGELLARVGHDLRAPLSAIIIYAARLEAVGAAVRQRALAIGQLAREQLALINGLIEYARAGVQPDAVLPRPLYLGTWLHSIADQANRRALRHGKQFGWRIEGALPDIVALDAKRARQVLLLLLTHATGRARQRPVGLRVEVLPAAGADGLSLAFTVSDDGPTLTAEQLATLFQPFLQLGSAEAHNEVGLAIACQWAERMQGSLRVLPSDCGLALRFTLPVTPACEEDIAPRHLQRQEPLLPELQGRGRRLWLADDSPVMREVLVAELSGLGFEVTVLAEGHQALDQLRTIGIEPPDLLLTDLRMPGVDGITLLRSARARWPGLPVVLLTSAPELISGQHDFSALLTKPVSLAELRTTLASLLDLELGAALVPGNSA